eukprot:gene13682-16114_t
MSTSDITDTDDSFDTHTDDEDEDIEPVQWTKLKDGWQEFLVDENAFFVPDEQNEGTNASSLAQSQIKDGDGQTATPSMASSNAPLIEDNRFYDPLSILKVPPRKSFAIKSHLISLESDQFDPVVFLSEIHGQTKFIELSEGLKKLKEASNTKDTEIKFLVKDNFEHFVKCKDTVDEVYNLITNSEMLEKMSGSFKKVIDKSSTVYNPLLHGKQEADHIRKVLTLLNKFKFIFKLPSKITENIRQGEFDKIVHNYKSAKSLISSNNKRAFQKVLLDIERIVEDFRSQLFSTLRDPHSKPEHLKRVIRVLIEIGNGKGEWSTIGDPCWYCLSNKHTAISTLIKQCHGDTAIATHRRIQRLSILLLSNVPNLYKMGRSYIEGRFDLGKVDSPIVASSRNQAHPVQQMLVGSKAKEAKNVTVIVHYLDETFSSYRVDHDKKINYLIEMCMKRFVDDVSEYSMYKLSEKKSKHDSLNRIKLVELAPDASPYKLFKKWMDKSGKSTHKFLFKKRTEEFSKNSQGVHVIQKDMNSSFKSHKREYSAATSALNEEKFKKLIIELLELYSNKVEDLFFNEDDDSVAITSSVDGDQANDTSTNMVENVNEVIKCLEMLVGLGMPEDYLVSIRALVESLTLHFVNRICSEMVGEVSFLYLLEDWTINDDAQNMVISANQVDGMITTRLLDEFFNTIKSSLQKLSFLVNNPTVIEKLGVLEKMIFDKYLQEKNEDLVDLVIKGILCSGIDWSSKQPPTGVSSYVMTLLTKLVFIHNEVMKTINSLSVAKGILMRIFEYLLTSFHYNYSQIDSAFISSFGQQQFMLDVQFLETTLSPYASERSAKLSASIRETLKEQSKNRKDDGYKQQQPNVTTIDQIIRTQTQKTSLLFSCFTSFESDH